MTVTRLTTALALALAALAGSSHADVLSIPDVQYTTDPDGDSPYDGEIHSVVGGIVTHIWAGWNDRVYLRDPAHPTWGAIMVKDREGALTDALQIGDLVRFDDIMIEEFRGTTMLQYDSSMAPDVSFTVESSGHTVPAPTMLTAADLCIPVDHAASEPYESMIVTLEDVLVGEMDLGKADDNYELIQGADLAWGADYMNVDAGGPYHPWIYTGAELSSITGIVEQYTKLSDGWDYYQLLTRFSADIVPEPGSLGLLLLGVTVVLRRR
jgi:hypothetical protein